MTVFLILMPLGLLHWMQLDFCPLKKQRSILMLLLSPDFTTTLNFEILQEIMLTILSN